MFNSAQRFLCSAIGAMFAEAVAAIYRTIVLGKERNFGFFAAIGADHFVHLTSLAAIMIATTLIPTVAATCRLVLEALFRVEFLLARAEDKFFTAVFADQCLVLKCHNNKNSLTLKKITPPHQPRLDCIIPSIKKNASSFAKRS